MDLLEEVTDLSEEGRNMAGNNCGSENSGSLFRRALH